MFSIKRTTSIDSDFLALEEELDQDLLNRYGEQQRTFTSHNYIDLAADVVAIYINAQPVGCGCFRAVDSQVAEVNVCSQYHPCSRVLPGLFFKSLSNGQFRKNSFV